MENQMEKTQAEPLHSGDLFGELWSIKQEDEQQRLISMIGRPEDWHSAYVAGWGFRRVIEIPKEYIVTENHQWTDYEPYWRDDLKRFIWVSAKCGTLERGETWRSFRISPNAKIRDGEDGASHSL